MDGLQNRSMPIVSSIPPVALPRPPRHRLPQRRPRGVRPPDVALVVGGVEFAPPAVPAVEAEQDAILPGGEGSEQPRQASSGGCAGGSSLLLEASVVGARRVAEQRAPREAHVNEGEPHALFLTRLGMPRASRTLASHAAFASSSVGSGVSQVFVCGMPRASLLPYQYQPETLRPSPRPAGRTLMTRTPSMRRSAPRGAWQTRASPVSLGCFFQVIFMVPSQTIRAASPDTPPCAHAILDGTVAPRVRVGLCRLLELGLVVALVIHGEPPSGPAPPPTPRGSVPPSRSAPACPRCRCRTRYRSACRCRRTPRRGGARRAGAAAPCRGRAASRTTA